MTQHAQTLLWVERNTRDLSRAAAFYHDALGFRIEAALPAPWLRAPAFPATPTRCAMLALGAQRIVLAEFPHAAAYPADTRCCDRAFQHCAIVVSDMAAAHRRALQHGATAITAGGPQRLPPAAGAVTAWKFRDPDGHPLELLAFPAGGGAPQWHTANGFTLGIDHSAISVGNVAHSVAFYEKLGLQVGPRSVNHGPGQQRLDALENVEVDVVALQPAAATPHVELLGYRQPHGGAAPPQAFTAIAADRLILRVDSIAAALAALDPAYIVHRSGAGHALLHDPDGHVVVLTET
ncbi:MAG: glyoxalase [Nevskiaceae bacterium]|nr:MAG: glyoxalase [Nevskiaceae bacterium]TBR73888.1 MAG: glyoxalase [Nevskiaceae bacterium]